MRKALISYLYLHSVSGWNVDFPFYIVAQEMSWCLVIPCCIARQEHKLSKRMNEWMVNSVSLQLASLTGTKKLGRQHSCLMYIESLQECLQKKIQNILQTADNGQSIKKENNCWHFSGLLHNKLLSKIPLFSVFFLINVITVLFLF